MVHVSRAHSEEDRIGELKNLSAVQSRTRPEKIRRNLWYAIFKDHIMLSDYELHDGANIELYYN